MRKKKDKYKFAYQTYKIVCNNSVNGGDCRGETYCNNCDHKDFWCDNGWNIIFQLTKKK